ncbi:MAG: hypothetical protein IJP49_04445 [Bacteroidales bacterium]|nr:hypothetical protein [Bacteroidales bacterium]
MKKLFKLHLISLALCLLPLCLHAQEKTLAYYNTHESEILPDAQAAFRMGDYERTLELCHWHYIIFGDDSAYTLRDKSERCKQLTKEMNELQSAGNVEEAKQKASAILSLNPNDESAKATLSSEKVAHPVQAEDTMTVTSPVETVDVPVETDNLKDETVQPTFEEKPLEEPVVKPEPTPAVTPIKNHETRSRFVVKAGASILDLNQLSQTIAPGGAIGLYDLGGSRIGLEVGGFLCPGLSSLSASLMGLDAGLVIRAAKGIYPKLGVGFFSCKSTELTDSATLGLSAGGGITFLLGGHFCVEVGAKYYPAVKVGGTETVSTAGASYEFPSSPVILSGGIAPEVRIGFVF